MYVQRLAVATVLAVAILAVSPVSVLADDFMLVAPITPPGNAPPNEWGGVLRFGFSGTGALTPLSTIPADLVSDPVSAAFAADGELFIGNRHGNQGSGLGSISRFTFDQSGGFSPNGTITGNNLEAVHGIDFSPDGELFAANVLNGTVSRFLFDPARNAIPNGTIPTLTDVQGLAVSPWGELFLAADENTNIQRFVFDSAGNAIPNGSFQVAGAARALLLGFSLSGELFIPDAVTGEVYRYEFDANHVPTQNGAIAVPGAGAVAFSPLGELFVSSNDAALGGIYRFVFDEQGDAISNGFVAGYPLGSIAIIPEPGTLLLLTLAGLAVMNRRGMERAH